MPALRESLRATVLRLKALPHWKDIVDAGLGSTDPVRFARAETAAKALDLDTWEHHFARLESGIDRGWYSVMQTDDASRIDRVLGLAERMIPLARIATGPANALGLGPEWAAHGDLDFVLQGLRRFPGKGWALLRAGIRSPVIRNRHMALKALSSWDAKSWPSDAKGLLRLALASEPTKAVRDEIEALLAAKKVEAL